MDSFITHAEPIHWLPIHSWQTTTQSRVSRPRCIQDEIWYVTSIVVKLIILYSLVKVLSTSCNICVAPLFRCHQFVIGLLFGFCIVVALSYQDYLTAASLSCHTCIHIVRLLHSCSCMLLSSSCHIPYQRHKSAINKSLWFNKSPLVKRPIHQYRWKNRSITKDPMIESYIGCRLNRIERSEMKTDDARKQFSWKQSLPISDPKPRLQGDLQVSRWDIHPFHS